MKKKKYLQIQKENEASLKADGLEALKNLL